MEAVIGPLVCWISRRAESEWVNVNGKSAMNFQLSMLLYIVLAIPLCFILIGIPIIIFLAIFRVVCIVVASIKGVSG